ncbi:Cold-Shock Protein [Chrysochromulina ericina virus CeV-01B]|uniref:Cold-Shock Protein n=1 Tax=Chrysochromulina ericina virus CeV-01B TaxID=3070830 RepID=A0A0N9QJF4_9VIRU|nr:cold shock protein [Chrysochromulina ericina virus]ALH23330.1 Cold-Shock Protein [Chrysochromulina ericina virus CeV-01B]
MYIMTSQETQVVSSSGESSNAVTRGRVKWFNNRAGYGFITVSSGDHKNEDVFVHHSAVQVKQEQYRYLVQGEYVDFKLCAVSNESHKWQAGEVSGVDGEKLMCETRLESRATRTTHKDSTAEGTRPTPAPRHVQRDSTEQGHYRVRSRGSGPREGDEWMLVRRKPLQSQSQSQYRDRSTSTRSPQKEPMRARNPRQGDYRVLNNDGDA